MGEITKAQKRIAEICANCVVRSYARKRQKGRMYTIAKLESRICPFCSAYEDLWQEILRAL